eukprot:s3945_g15.t1
MIRECSRGLDYDDRFANMTENVIAMHDLTDDEESPTHSMTEQQVLDLTLEYQQTFEMALVAANRERFAQSQAAANTSEQAAHMEEEEGDAETERSETDAERLDRYMRDGLDEVSDHEYWHELHHGD